MIKAKKKTAKAVKKRIPASRGPKAGGAPLRLEVGKYYESEKGKIVGPLAMDGEGDFMDKDGRYSWVESGQPWVRGMLTDKECGRLVREVPRPPRAK